MKRPALASILFGLIPFAACCFSVAWWDRIYPMVFGIPFNFFWLILWMVLTPVCIWAAYRVETRREMQSPEERGGASGAIARGEAEGGAD